MEVIQGGFLFHTIIQLSKPHTRARHQWTSSPRQGAQYRARSRSEVPAAAALRFQGFGVLRVGGNLVPLPKGPRTQIIGL